MDFSLFSSSMFFFLPNQTIIRLEKTIKRKFRYSFWREFRNYSQIQQETNYRQFAIDQNAEVIKSLKQIVISTKKSGIK